MTRDVLADTAELGLQPTYRGKVRDLFDLGDELLIVATDRISAYDVIMNQPVPGKGVLLTRISVEWFRLLADRMPNHLISDDWRDFPRPYRQQALAGRSMLVRKTERLDLECVVRGYLVGSGWSDYRRTGAVCGLALPPGLEEADRLDSPLFTPSTKAATGHDENVSHAEAASIVGEEWFPRLRDASLDLYRAAEAHARTSGIIIADTKLEFGRVNGELVLIDEIFTPDSSRFWAASDWRPGRTPDSFDKQILRRHLDQAGWNREGRPPDLPPELVERLRRRYEEILGILFPDAGGRR
jgi:phosphoribosylaminoimidazole-succinocarboxamide synthase